MSVHLIHWLKFYTTVIDKPDMFYWYVSSYWVKKTDDHDWYETTSLNSGLPPYTWHHIAVVLNSDRVQFTVYHDGAEYGTQSINTYHFRSAGSGDVRIGSTVHHPSSTQPGAPTIGPPPAYGGFEMDELVIWNKALSASQISQIYNTEPY